MWSSRVAQPPDMAATSREEAVVMAKLAEEAERYTGTRNTMCIRMLSSALTFR